MKTKRVFHSSPVDDIEEFRPGTHFGKREAALDRSHARKFRGIPMTLYEVELQVASPLEIQDEGGSHTVEYLVSSIREADRRGLNRFAADAILTKAEEEGEAAGMQLLCETMTRFGRYDSLVYKNTGEGPKGKSWVIFDASQVTILAAERIPVPQPSMLP